MADVNARIGTVVLLALLVRGLAATLRAEAAAGVPAPGPHAGRLREAHLLAAAHRRHGRLSRVVDSLVDSVAAG
ncbi:hypothetical protein [Streptomyces sp. TBY4]|uniref:hypothetical protein n=1 Tax=Streptomyces sp. TBY4 TaxID=2962030 RepID=UPI0020B8D746|nr:hypothetical protein [Streptomyces sp. TBY4]MCP3759256.1 hypothetical protein [Streptomyces sp. TBY4]